MPCYTIDGLVRAADDHCHFIRVPLIVAYVTSASSHLHRDKVLGSSQRTGRVFKLN